MKTILPQKLTVQEHIGVNFINGFVDAELNIHPHKPEHGMTYVLPYRYLPEKAGLFPQFNQLLHGYWSEDEDYDEKVMALQEAMCATVLGLAPKYQKAFLFHGAGSVGKSQLLDIISELVPPQARSNIKPDKWKEDYAAVIINEKLLNIAGELSDKSKIQGDVFKEIVTGDEISARKPYHGFFSFRPKAAHWFSSNFLPNSTDTSEGFFRRWLCFEFTREIPKEEKILNFGKKIVASEMESIIAWALESYARLKNATSYTEPVSHRRLINQMSNQNSSVRYFLSNCEELHYGSGDTSIEDLHKLYFCWIPRTGMRPVSIRKFALEISIMSKRDRKFDIMTKNGETQYVGLKIKT
jgi:P4 family phage/plasmid primase-like protien